MTRIKNETWPEHQKQVVHKDEIIQKCTIEHLATEILTIIFLYTDVNRARRNWDVAAQEMRREGRWKDVKKVLGHRPALGGYGPPRNFPYNIAGVCSQWREILSIYPSYWTELDIQVNTDEPTPVSQLKLYLEYSKKLSLRFSLERRNKYSAPQDPDPRYEQHRVRRIIDALKPHLHRCTSIAFDVFHGSALPSFSYDLRTLSSDLKYLTLECNTDDCQNAGFLGDSSNVDGAIPEPTWPKLTGLHLAGHTVADALKHAPTLLTQKGGVIKFENYRGDPENEDHFLSHLHRVFSTETASGPETLTFVNVSVPRWRAPPESRVSWNITQLHIEHSTEILLNLMKYVDFDSLSLLSINAEWDCEIELPDDLPPLPACDVLILGQITNDLHHLLSKWNGSELQLIGCHRVSDKFIRFLTKRKANGSCDLLSKLTVFCSLWDQPSPKAIMELASAESPAFTDSDGTYYPPHKMESIDIQEGDVEMLSKKDIRRLEKDFSDVIFWSCSDGGGVGE